MSDPDTIPEVGRLVAFAGLATFILYVAAFRTAATLDVGGFGGIGAIEYRFGDYAWNSAYTHPAIMYVVVLVLCHRPKARVIWFGWLLAGMSTYSVLTGILLLTNEAPLAFYLTAENNPNAPMRIGFLEAVNYISELERFKQDQAIQQFSDKLDRDVMTPILLVVGWGINWLVFLDVRRQALECRESIYPS